MGKADVTVRILGDPSGAKKAFAEVEGSAGGFGSKLGAVAGGLAKGFGVASVAAQVFGVKAVMAASDLNETLSKTQVVFGNATGQVTGFADEMAKKFGLNKRVMLDAASSFGLIAKASGLAQPQAAKMSTELAKLASDASSFYNVPLEEALQAIQSGLVGEAEPMRRFGVLLNEAAVQAEAVALGLAKQGEELTEGQKAQARASLIMKGMKDASGDLERTQGSLSNRLRELKGRAENFAMAVGTKLLPFVLKGMDAFEKIGEKVQLFGRIFMSAFNDPDVTSSGLHGQIEKVGVAARKLVDFFNANIGPAMETVKVAFTRAGEVASKVWDGIQKAVAQAWAKIGPTVMELVEDFRKFFDDISKKGDEFKEAFGHIWNVIKGIWAVVGDDIMNIVGRVFNAIGGIIGGVMQAIRGVISLVLALINGDWGKAWDAIKGILGGVWDAMYALVGGVLGSIKSVIAGVGGLIGEVWGKIWGDVADVFSGVWEGIKRIAIGAINFITQNVINPFIRGLNMMIETFNKLPGVGDLPRIAEIARIASGVEKGAAGGSSAGGVRYMAHGGMGTVTSPTVFVAGEAGAEDFAFAPRSKGGFAAMGGGTQTIILQLDGREITRVVVDQVNRQAAPGSPVIKAAAVG